MINYIVGISYTKEDGMVTVATFVEAQTVCSAAAVASRKNEQDGTAPMGWPISAVTVTISE